MAAERPTFSPMFHRIRAMKPRLRPHVQITRQHYRGRRWHVVHDPTSNQFYRLSPIAHEFVCMLDGQRTIEEIWEATLGQHGDDAPTQGEVVELVGQLYNSNLLSADASPEAEQLLRRGRERVRKRITQQAIGIMYLRIPVFNPDRLLTWVEPILRPLLNRWGFLAWLGLVIAALIALAGHTDALFSQFESAIAPSNWWLLGVVFIVTKAIHELGHGVICKRFGGQVPEMGFMLLVLFPAPYVDVSSCWTLPSKWKRISVGAGGMIFELFIASLAAFAWLNTASGSLFHQLAYNAMFTASISTILFNANPLMRFDGYYILSDLLEVPNLMQRSTKQLQYLWQKYIYRLPDAKPASTQPGEREILVVYGILAMAYRIFLFFSITLYVMGKLFAIGLILAIWTAAVWFILPLGKFTHWLAASPKLSDHRVKTIGITLVTAVLLFVGLGVIPAPDHRRASGVVESTQRQGVFFGTTGFIEEALVKPGQHVEKDQALLIARSPELEAQIIMLEAQIAELEAIERDMVARSALGAEIVRERIAAVRGQMDFFDDQRSRLTVRAPHAGIVVGPSLERLVGAYVQRGQAICEIVNTDQVRVTASLSTAQALPINEMEEAGVNVTMELRAMSNIAEIVRGGRYELIKGGHKYLPHAALGFSGGGTIETDPRDREGTLSRDTRFTLYVHSFTTPDGTDAPDIGLPGERVSLRFTLPDKPLMVQWIDRLHKLIQGRINV